ncbi:Stf0 family sulfotransferase [Mycobacterium sp. AT1]|uniref:Stf0 family sulfotransferase n=1 Tax=Mycobacterium sp. AT1 TaxID=1961706 RepID=UPI0009AD97A8|nr:Stf0 family sulfotransferase [Mycobacterium sp. AT1]OPX08642.1 hypothetical protein B1790_18535 [Mycobacterium sp. AT1]
MAMQFGGIRTLARTDAHLHRLKVAAAAKSIPAEDFVDRQYDEPEATQTTDVMILLSTPRSGSTLLCELIRKNYGYTAHEYLQPFQYMPLLADRWSCLKNGVVDGSAYIDALRRHRTHKNGWLGINVHGNHLPYFVGVEEHLRDVRIHYLYLRRQDHVAQAISFEIARQSRKWSNQFDSTTAAKYSFRRILRMLKIIQNQNTVIQSFLTERGVPYQELTYESLVARPRETVLSLPGLASDRPLSLTPRLCRQANQQSEEWTQRFVRDVLDDQFDPETDLGALFKFRHALKLRRLPTT